jgi:DNA-binding GntR family transcriptional regulator
MALTLPPELASTLADLSAASGKPAATVVVELLTELQPALRDTAKYLRAVKAGRNDVAKKALRNLLGDAMADLYRDLQPSLPLGGKKRQ